MQKQSINLAFRKYLEICEHARSKKMPEMHIIKRAFRLVLEVLYSLNDKTAIDKVLLNLTVATRLIKDFDLCVSSLVCAMVYNTIRDIDFVSRIKSEISNEVATLYLRVVTLDIFISDLVSCETDKYSFNKLSNVLFADARIILIKLLQSLLSLGNVKPNSITAQNILIIQIQKIYIPLAHQIGLYDLKRELEDMYMKIVNPNKYAKLHQLIQPEISPTILHSMIEAMCKTLSNEGLSVSIKNRHKGIYSTWQKMLKQNLEYEEVYDSFGIRIIILNISIEEEKLMCWQVYKIITNMYLVNPNKARNWLENPKKNGYQSLHLLILGENDKWMEVQIRSERMHKLAEDGDAAHWLYKNKSMHIDTYEKLFITSLKNQLLLLKNS